MYSRFAAGGRLCYTGVEFEKGASIMSVLAQLAVIFAICLAAEGLAAMVSALSGR